MDDTLLSLVSLLVRVQTLLMDSRFANVWTSMAVKRQLATSLPNLADVCTSALARWLDVQKGKIEGIRERSARMGRWEQMRQMQTQTHDTRSLSSGHSHTLFSYRICACLCVWCPFLLLQLCSDRQMDPRGRGERPAVQSQRARSVCLPSHGQRRLLAARSLHARLRCGRIAASARRPAQQHAAAVLGARPPLGRDGRVAEHLPNHRRQAQAGEGGTNR